MELRPYNLLRQEKYKYETIPSDLVALAARRAAERDRKLDRVREGLDTVVIIVACLGALYLTGHVLVWVLK